MNTTTSDPLRVIAYREGDAWVAQVVEYDIAAQGCDFETAMRRLRATVRAECKHTRAKHGTDFAGIGPAPAVFAEWFDAAHQSLMTDHLELRIAA
ncbi:MAG: hypothetical protein ACTHLU_01190 [Novosphingobium sp.]